MAGATPEVMEAVEKYIAALRERIPVEKVVLFGSYVTGRVYEDSDIDLAVFSPAFGCNPLADRQLLYQVLLESEADPRIEAHPFPCGPVRGARAVFLEEIVASGRVVYERGEGYR